MNYSTLLAVSFCIVVVLVFLVVTLGWLCGPSLMLLPYLGVPIGLLAIATGLYVRRFPGSRLQYLSGFVVLAYLLLPLTDWPFRLVAPFWAKPLSAAADAIRTDGKLSRPIAIWPFTLDRGYRTESGGVYLSIAGNALVSPRSSGSAFQPWWTVHLTPEWDFITTD